MATWHLAACPGTAHDALYRIARRRAWFRWPGAGWLVSADLLVPPAAGAARLPFRLTRAG
jgi:hypothetical protein